MEKLDAERGPNLVRLMIGTLARPKLLILMLRTGFRFRARGWWRRPPFLPLPPTEYLEWRLHTAYGDEGVSPERGELERYLRWVIWMNRRSVVRSGEGRA